ncbi:Type II/IV secretion system protein TadC, associated with Flp pilus assembly [Marinobacterium lacunae]|uniref:Type II/IV secretion system protein TadC, associated with Flp pilus assembly n=1 Tax=Marinobacterium lacunae TaxID=1232683 RepID=A0A081G416_9GAMM|nr:type II secretion system F family protein [Marinobacterium lacunae]KEA65521.1 Type II/IV secretion system protein TadC, associated with Flp pilus assembly [Marinobacterium lacunae]
METLIELINQQLGNELYARYVVVALVAAAALAFGLSLTVLVTGLATPFRQRIRVLTGRYDKAHGHEGRNKVISSLDPLTRHLLPGKDWDKSQLHAQLVHAGFRAPNAMSTLYALKVLSSLVLFGIAWLVTSFRPELTADKVLFICAGAAYFGYILPNIVLDRMANRRIRAIRNGFPDALDLLVVCVESGLGLTAALQRVGQELEVSHPELSEELHLVNVEIRAGVNRIEALRGMAQRTGVEDIRGLVALLDQSVRFGSSIADTLRVYSEEFRDKRMQAAEEQAAKIGTKMIFPLTFCIWPGFFVVAVGPAILKVLEVFGH